MGILFVGVSAADRDGVVVEGNWSKLLMCCSAGESSYWRGQVVKESGGEMRRAEVRKAATSRGSAPESELWRSSQSAKGQLGAVVLLTTKVLGTT
jgi:hypothetical protein